MPVEDILAPSASHAPRHRRTYLYLPAECRTMICAAPDSSYGRVDITLFISHARCVRRSGASQALFLNHHLVTKLKEHICALDFAGLWYSAPADQVKAAILMQSCARFSGRLSLKFIARATSYIKSQRKCWQY